MEFEDAEPADNSTQADQSYIHAHEIAFMVFALIAMVADLLIIYIIFKFQQLYTVANVFIANWAISDVASLIFTPSAYRILSLHKHLPESRELICILSDSGTLLHCITLMFVILVALDWIISAYIRRASRAFRKHYRFIVGAIWISAVGALALAVGLCCLYEEYYGDMFFKLLFILIMTMFAVIVSVQLARLVQKLRKRPADVPNLPINLVTVHLCCWIFAVFKEFVTMQLYYGHILLELAANCMVFSSAIFNLGLMYFCNKDFHACAVEVFRCKRRDKVNQVIVLEDVDDDTKFNVIL